MEPKELADLITESNSLDLSVLLTAKENAKRNLLEAATEANIKAFEKARQALADATAGPTESAYDNRTEAWEALMRLGYKISRSSFYSHCKKGLCKCEKDKTITESALKKYIKERHPETKKDDASEKAGLKQDKEIRRIDIENELKEIELNVKKGIYGSRNELAMERVAVIGALGSRLKNNARMRSDEYIEAVSGDGSAAKVLEDMLVADIDAVFNELAGWDNFEVIFRRND